MIGNAFIIIVKQYFLWQLLKPIGIFTGVMAICRDNADLGKPPKTLFPCVCELLPEIAFFSKNYILPLRPSTITPPPPHFTPLLFWEQL